MDALARLRTKIDPMLREAGGVLFRGFASSGVQAFREFAAAFGHPLLSYEFASTPRTAVGSGIYTSTEYPAHQHIPLHSEQAYTREWPMKIWFHCVTPAPVGGETPIADNRAIFQRMPRAIRERFAAGILYVRNYGDFDVPLAEGVWHRSVEERRGILPAQRNRVPVRQSGGRLTTRQLCRGIERHPVTGESGLVQSGASVSCVESACGRS